MLAKGPHCYRARSMRCGMMFCLAPHPEMPVQIAEGLEIYLQLAGQERDPERDNQLLDRLEALEDEIAPDGGAGRSALVDLDNCVQAISGSPVLLPVALGRWLGGDAHLRLGKAVVERASVAYLNQRFPQSFDLRAVPVAASMTTAGRLCALGAAPAVSLGWTLSMFRDYPEEEGVRGRTRELLDYHVDQLLVSTVELLASPESSFQTLDVSIETLARARDARRVLDGMPRLRELDMTAEMRLLHSALKRSEHREVHRRADEASVFRHLMHRIKLKYATRPVIEVRNETGTHEMAVAMSSHELALELPLSELTDPVVGRLRRNRLWRSPQA